KKITSERTGQKGCRQIRSKENRLTAVFCLKRCLQFQNFQMKRSRATAGSFFPSFRSVSKAERSVSPFFNLSRGKLGKELRIFCTTKGCSLVALAISPGLLMPRSKASRTRRILRVCQAQSDSNGNTPSLF